MNRALQFCFGKSSTSSPVEMTSLPGEMSTAEVKSQKNRKRRKIEWGSTSDGDVEWSKSLSECQLELMVSVKQLAMERVRSTREKSLNGLLTPAGLRAIDKLGPPILRMGLCRRSNSGSASRVISGTPVLTDAVKGDRLWKHDEEKLVNASV